MLPMNPDAHIFRTKPTEHEFVEPPELTEVKKLRVENAGLKSQLEEIEQEIKQYKEKSEGFL